MMNNIVRISVLPQFNKPAPLVRINVEGYCHQMVAAVVAAVPVVHQQIWAIPKISKDVLESL
jgi:hypothetical protein